MKSPSKHKVYNQMLSRTYLKNMRGDSQLCTCNIHPLTNKNNVNSQKILIETGMKSKKNKLYAPPELCI